MSLLNYIKQIWDTTSYVNPTRMNHMEEGIYAVSNKVDNLSAEDIAYDSNNSVKDKIDEYNLSANTKVNLSSYTSSNPYTFPSNGYLLYENNGSTLGRGYISNLLRVGDQFGTDFTKTSGNALYVKKGMTFYVETAFYKVEFYPLQ